MWKLWRRGTVGSTGDQDTVIWLPPGSAMCSVLVNVTLAVMYAEANHMRVYFDETDTPLRDPDWPSFWNRYFTPIGCPGGPPPDSQPVKLFFDPDNTPKIHVWAESVPLAIPSLGLSGEPLAVTQRFVRRFVRPQRHVRRWIDARRRALGLPDFYVAAHIRRGDKVTLEPLHPVTPVERYVEANGALNLNTARVAVANKSIAP